MEIQEAFITSISVSKLPTLAKENLKKDNRIYKAIHVSIYPTHLGASKLHFEGKGLVISGSVGQ